MDVTGVGGEMENMKNFNFLPFALITSNNKENLRETGDANTAKKHESFKGFSLCDRY